MPASLSALARHFSRRHDEATEAYSGEKSLALTRGFFWPADYFGLTLAGISGLSGEMR